MKRNNCIRIPEEFSMNKKSSLIAGSILLSAILVEPALGAFRCGTHLLVAGDARAYEVLKKCGQPDERYGNTWVYKKSGFTHELRFDRDDRLVDINRQ